MNLINELNNNDDLNQLFTSILGDIKPFVKDINGSVSSWEKEPLSIAHNLSHIPNASEILTCAYQVYLRWNIAKDLQNDTFTRSTIYFLDVLRDFDFLTVIDGFSDDELFPLEVKYENSVRNQLLPKLDLFVSLGIYLDYQNHLDEILSLPVSEKWIFPSAKEQQELALELEKITFCPSSSFKSLFNGSSSFLPSVTPFPIRLNHSQIDMIVSSVALDVSISTKFEFKQSQWFNLVSYAFAHNAYNAKRITHVAVFFARFNSLVFLPLELFSAEQEKELKESVSSFFHTKK